MCAIYPILFTILKGPMYLMLTFLPCKFITYVSKVQSSKIHYLQNEIQRAPSFICITLLSIQSYLHSILYDLYIFYSNLYQFRPNTLLITNFLLTNWSSTFPTIYSFIESHPYNGLIIVVIHEPLKARDPPNSLQILAHMPLKGL